MGWQVSAALRQVANEEYLYDDVEIECELIGPWSNDIEKAL